MSRHPAQEPSDRTVVALQIGRAPRTPWRVAARCSWGFPTVIVSPSVLDDGERFPTYAWLTCPWLAEVASARESAGAAAQWAQRAAADPAVRDALVAVDRRVRELRAAESPAGDAVPDVGLAGQRDPAGVKCLHAHTALALLGLADPVGEELLEVIGARCDDGRCARLASEAPAREREGAEEDA